MIVKLTVNAEDLIPRPLSRYAMALSPDGKIPVSEKVLNDWARMGKIPGVHRGPDRRWWVNPLAMIGFDATDLQIEVLEASDEEERRRNGADDRQAKRKGGVSGETPSEWETPIRRKAG